MEMNSEQLYQSQAAKKITIERTEEEKMAPNAPLVSLADMAQLQKGSSISEAHKKKHDAFLQKVNEAVTTTQKTGVNIGDLQKAGADEAVTEYYLSVTSGYSIASLKNDLENKWKYQRYNGSNSEAMLNLKKKLTDLTGQFDKEITFTSYKDIKDGCDALSVKYRALISSCEAYLAKSKSPKTIAGKARKAMAEKLLRAAVSEMEMLHDSAINCFDETKLVDPGVSSVKLKWDQILHHGRLRILRSDKDDYHFVNKRRDENTAEIQYKGSGKREVITYAQSEEELKGCRRVAAMSSLAQKLNLGRLAGGEEMSTRMATMMVDKKILTGVVTTGITKKTLSKYEYETGHEQIERPGKAYLPDRKVTYGADHLKDLLAIPFLDYLCGIHRDNADELGFDKREVPGGLVMGKIQANTHKLSKSGFGQDFREFDAPADTWIDKALADSILGLKEQDLLDMMTGVLDQEERATVVLRLNSLKTWINERRSNNPEIFKNDRDYENLVKNPAALAAYAQSQVGKTHRLLDVNIASKDQSRDLSVKETGMLRPLLDLAGEIKEPVGKNAPDLQKTLKGLTDEINKFNSYRGETVKFDESEKDFKLEIKGEFEPIYKVRTMCQNYLRQSTDPKDISNRIAVSNLLQASIYQEKIYSDHVFAMRSWAQSILQRGDDRSFGYIFDDLFKEAIYLGQRAGKAKDFSIDELYAGVTFTEEALCARTKTDTLKALADNLYKELQDKEQKGDENGVLINSIHKDLLDVIEARIQKIDDGFDEFLRSVAHLKYSCDSYLEKLADKTFGGSATTAGRTRKKLVKSILHTVNDEFGMFLDYSDVRLAKLKEDPLSHLKTSCTLDGKKDLTIGDICLAAKKDLLVAQEKDTLLNRGEAKQKHKKTKKEKSAEAVQQVLEKIQSPAKSFVEFDPLRMETYLSGLSGISSVRSFVKGVKETTQTDPAKMSKEDYENDYKLAVKQILELKDQPIFSQYEAQFFRKTLKKDKKKAYKDLHNSFISRYNTIADILQKAQRPLQGYYTKAADALIGGSTKKIKAVNDELFWEFYAFKTGEWINKAPAEIREIPKDETHMDDERIYDYIQMLVESGKPLEEITYTDMTNVLKMDRAYNAPFSVGKTEIGSDLEALDKALKKELGKKLVGTDAIEYVAVSRGMASLIAAKAGDDKDLLSSLYDNLAQKCEDYEKLHPDSTNNKMKLINRTRLVCIYERMRLGL